MERLDDGWNARVNRERREAGNGLSEKETYAYDWPENPHRYLVSRFA